MSAKTLNPSGKKHRFGKAWMHDHVNDPYVKEAQRLGYRSRSAFKLIELAEKDHLFRRGMVKSELWRNIGILPVRPADILSAASDAAE